MLVFGTRPETIKIAPIFHELKSKSNHFDVYVCVTGQHRQMLNQTLNFFNIKPDVDLKIMMSNQNLSDLTANILYKIKPILFNFKPEIVLVHGDTTTTVAAAISAFYAGIKIGHIEAGLRTNNMQEPFPEEFNRQVTSKIATWHFAPTLQSRKNLISENIEDDKIIVSGNTVIDSLYWVLERIKNDNQRSSNLNMILDKLLSFNWKRERFILITCHRRENFGYGIQQICSAIKKLASKFSSIKFIYPIHLNPNIQKPVRENLNGISNIYLIDPLDYEPFIYLLKHSYIILTDSGGIQEEAPSLGIPVLVMRDFSERLEAIEAGTVQLVGANKNVIFSKVSELINDEKIYEKMSKSHNPYGDGKASKIIVDILQNKL